VNWLKNWQKDLLPKPPPHIAKHDAPRSNQADGMYIHDLSVEIANLIFVFNWLGERH